MAGLWIPVMAFVLGALAGLLFKESRDQRVRTKPFPIFFKGDERMRDNLMCPMCGEPRVHTYYDALEDEYEMKCDNCEWCLDDYCSPEDLFADYENICNEHGVAVQYEEPEVGDIQFTCFGRKYIERPLFGGHRCPCGTDRLPVLKVQERLDEEEIKTMGGEFAGFTAVCPVCSRRVRGMNYMVLERRWNNEDFDWVPGEDLKVIEYHD